MTAGLEIINTSGSVLIDENYQNLAMSASGSFTFVSGDFGRVNVNIPYKADGLRNPIMAIRVTGGYAGVRNTSKNAVTSVSTAVMFGQTGATVQWWCFDVPDVTSNAGLQVFNSAGTLVFDSGNKYARVLNYWMPANNSAWTGAVQTLGGSGRTYAIAYCSPWWYKNALSSTAGCGGSQRKYSLFYEGSMCSVTGSPNTFTFDRITYRDDGGVFGECSSGDPRSRTGQPIFAFLDVTGY